MDPRLHRAAEGSVAAHLAKLVVITSYSIHYTKLYDLRFGVGDQVFDPIRNRMQVISTILADSQPGRLKITPVVVCLGHFPRKALPARVFWNNVSEDFAKVHKVKSSDFAIYGIVARSGAVHAASLVPWLKLRRCPPIFFHPRNKE